MMLPVASEGIGAALKDNGGGAIKLNDRPKRERERER